MIQTGYPIELPRDAIRSFCRQNAIRRLALFGSVLRCDFVPTSDLDVLVEFEPGARVGLRFFMMEQELSQIMGRRVDLQTPAFLSKYVRERVLRDAETIYESG